MGGLICRHNTMLIKLLVKYRISILIVAFLNLLVGIGSGLYRIGWSLPESISNIAAYHGPLMVCGFLGSVITIERAIAIGRLWGYLGSLLGVLGGLFIIAGFPWSISIIAFVFASLVLSFASIKIYLHQRALSTLTLLLGSVSWLIGNLLLVNGLNVPYVTYWWIGFLILTVAGERLELSRLTSPSPHSKKEFALVMLMLIIGMVVTTTFNGNVLLLSIAIIFLAIWLLRYDVAQHTIKQHGLTKFIAVCLLSGYVWLLLGGIIGTFTNKLIPGSSYDAFLHAILIGFIFSMIFGHAPIIFSAIIKIKIPYTPILYTPLIFLHASLVARIVGDLWSIPHLRGVGGIMNAVSLLLFFMSTVYAVFHASQQK